jgi:hypothetical protein
MEERPTQIFTTVLISLGLLKVTESNVTTYIGNVGNSNDKQYSNSEPAATFLVKGKPSYIGDIIAMFYRRLYKSLEKTVSIIKNKWIGCRKEGGDAEAIFNQSRSSQAIERIQKIIHAMFGLSIAAAIILSKVFDFLNTEKS